MIDDSPIIPDLWQNLCSLTPARIALGRAGMSLPTKACLDFQLAHALARDAVSIPLDFVNLSQRLLKQGYQSVTLSTQAENQRLYLQRPDLGRLLNNQARDCLQTFINNLIDVAIVVADGLSSKAIAQHSEALLCQLLPKLLAMGYQLSPLCLVKHGRVAIGDAIAENFNARLCIVLIGERPGLSSPDSMGIYFTYHAKSGISTDADRNCISNIHQNGLSYQQAINKLLFLIEQAEQLKFSGVNLKDETTDLLLEAKPELNNFLLD